jgi:hypothetical protein
MISPIGLLSTFVVAGVSIVLGFIVGRAIGEKGAGEADMKEAEIIEDNNIALDTQSDDVAATGS